MIGAKNTINGKVREAGLRGLSAYEIYVQHGGTLTEEEWLDSLRGPEGPQGNPGNPFTYEDFTPEQLEALRGPEGPEGKPFTYNDFTPEQLEELRGPEGKPFTYEDFTQEQLENLKGPQGDPFTYDDFTQEQLENLRGEPGKEGPAGEPGEDYVLTETDKEEIAQIVLNNLPVAEGVSF